MIPGGTITFLFTDIEGSTARWEQDAQAMGPELARHDAALRAALEGHGGHVFKRIGDSFLAAFATAPEAVGAALEAQYALAREAPGLAVRIALATGAADARDEDYFGPPLNRAARLLAAGHGGQVLLSEATRALAQGALPEGASLRPLGSHRLKDLQQPEAIYQLLHPELRTEFPPLRTLENHPNNLPRQTSSFIGREREIARVKELLAQTCILTLTGPGGCGKTRLALQAAADLLEQYPDGVWLVELAPLTDPALIPQAVASTFNVRQEGQADLMAAITAYLRERRLLLLLDNCEHLRADAARLAASLLRACPGLTVLATSREGLGVPGETTWIVPSLELPEPDKQTSLKRLAQYEAMALFTARARSVRPDFELKTREQALTCARLCRTLDGIPLALEIAAAWVGTLSVEQIGQRLGMCMSTPVGHVADPRQETLAATIQWSYDLLTEKERLLLNRLSVFAGGCTLEAAEHVCSGDGIEDAEIPSLLAGLVRKSLVAREQTPNQRTRYRLLETIGAYCRDRLDRQGAADKLRDRHRDYFLALAEEAEPNLQKPDQKEWLDRLDEDHDNLRAGLKWSATGEARLRMAIALHRFWYVRGYLSEGRSWLQGAITRARSAEPRIVARGRNALGILAWASGDLEAARLEFEECLAVFRKLKDLQRASMILNNLGIIAARLGDFVRARALFQESYDYWQTVGDAARSAMALTNMAGVSLDLGDLDTASPWYEAALRTFRELRDNANIANVLHDLGIIATMRRDLSTARVSHLESLEIRKELADKRGIAYSLSGLALLQEQAGKVSKAAELIGASETLRESIEATRESPTRIDIDSLVVRLRQALGNEEFDAAWRRGSGWSLAEAVEHGLDPEIDDNVAEAVRVEVARS